LEEETGIKPGEVRIIDGFSRSVNYFYKWGGDTVHKEVIYFLAETDREDVRISDEHDSYAWMTGREVASYVHYRNLRESIAEAESFLSSKSCVASPISQHQQLIKWASNIPPLVQHMRIKPDSRCPRRSGL
jgi:hypothetical protein